VELVSADGAKHIALTSDSTVFGFSRDGRTLYAIRQAENKKWELAAYGVPSGEEKRAVPLDLPASAAFYGFSVSPDGRSFMTSVGKARFDIWLLEGFAQRRRWVPFGNP
jgi:sugar lactone lactonase YvrE